MGHRVRLGILTPSSNTALEPLTSAMVAELDGVSAHFARFPVTEIALSESALAQFDDSKILSAARLLADARVDVIVWSGTSGGWLGFEQDQALCLRIRQAVGIEAATSVLALNEILAQTNVRRMGLVTPYTDDVQRRIVANYRQAGVECVGEEHLDICVNFDFAEVDEARIRAAVAAVAATGPQAITTFCTNLRAAALAPELEREHGIPLYDTVSTAVWKALRMVGVDVRPLARWGSLFADVR